MLSPYGTLTKYGVEDRYKHCSWKIDLLAKSTELKDIIDRESPDRFYNLSNGTLQIYGECKETKYDENNINHSLQVPAIQFIMLKEFYNNKYPVVYFIYSIKMQKWYVFALDEAVHLLDHVKHVKKNNTTILDQYLPAVPRQDCEPKDDDASGQDMLAFKDRLQELSPYWLKKMIS